MVVDRQLWKREKVNDNLVILFMLTLESMFTKLLFLKFLKKSIFLFLLVKLYMIPKKEKKKKDYYALGVDQTNN